MALHPCGAILARDTVSCMRRRATGGFTLVEVMIVVAIIGILASVAIPSYQNYSLRAKVSEAILALSTCRTTVSEVYQSADTGPGANNWGCENASATSKYVQSLSTSVNGMVSVTLQNLGPLNGKIHHDTPHEQQHGRRRHDRSRQGPLRLALRRGGRRHHPRSALPPEQLPLLT